MYIRNMWKLIFRAALLAFAIGLHLYDGGSLDFASMRPTGFRLGLGSGFLLIVWIVLVIDMLYRIIPNKRISIGARKHYACSYSAAPLSLGKEAPKVSHKGAVGSMLAFMAVNAALFAVLWAFDALTPSAAVIIMLAYAFLDLVFIMFFCPFRKLFMKNRCCQTCRIYNWDYIMMCVPLIVFPHAYSLSLFALSAAVLARWEMSVKKNPRFFMPETNENLRCSKCNEKRCPLRDEYCSPN